MASEYRVDYSPEETRNHIDFMRLKMGVRNIEFQPRAGRGLHAHLLPNADQCTVRTRCDFSITPFVLVNHHWEVEQLLFARKAMERHNNVVVVDVGANIGLFSRQILGWLNNTHHLYAYEPEPENFSCLMHNLGFFKNFTAQMVGLADHEGSTTLHIDLSNCGNNSLVSDDLAGAWSKSAMEVRILDIVTESRRWLRHGLPIFYKSDTQGYDEFLASLLPDDVRAALIGGIIEIEQTEKPPFDIARFRSFLDSFEYKAILHPDATEDPISTEQTLDLLNSTAEAGSNIAFRRL
ncbi:FkbM family methyltransferase [Niveispirillum sp. KHB5.9]|uniref:FkbM family methyltransferase n=1 Tax=Niveispirillum sp. KHB5.9 TaxID=3400269 RepID=UPI003A89D183